MPRAQAKHHHLNQSEFRATCLLLRLCRVVALCLHHRHNQHGALVMARRHHSCQQHLCQGWRAHSLRHALTFRMHLRPRQAHLHHLMGASRKLLAMDFNHHQFQAAASSQVLRPILIFSGSLSMSMLQLQCGDRHLLCLFHCDRLRVA